MAQGIQKGVKIFCFAWAVICALPSQAKRSIALYPLSVSTSQFAALTKAGDGLTILTARLTRSLFLRA